MMDSPALRVLDRSLGKGVCFGLSLVLAPLKWIPRRARRPQRILLVELFEMGASVMLQPSLRVLREKLPQAEIWILTTELTEESWKVFPDVDPNRIYVIRGKGVIPFLWGCLCAVFSLSRVGFDLIIDYVLFFRISAVLVALIWSRQKAGFFRYHVDGVYRGNFLTFPCSYNQNLHIAKNFLALTQTALETASDYPNYKGAIRSDQLSLPRIALKPEWVESVSKKLDPFRKADTQIIGISPDVGKNLSQRNYPLASWAAVLKSLEAYPRLLPVLIGTMPNRWVEEELRKLGSTRWVSLIGQTTFPELLAFLAQSTLVVANDNGIAHFCGLTETPSVALFSTDSPFVYGPLGPCTVLYSFFQCSPCISAWNHKQSTCADNRCLQVISPQMVLDFIHLGLKGKLRPQTIQNGMSYLL